MQEGLNWLSAALACDGPQSDKHRQRAYGLPRTEALLLSLTGSTEGREEAEQALATARDLGDPALVVRALTSCGALVNAYDREVAGPFFAEATELARELGDSRSLAQIIALDWMTGRVLDEPAAAQVAAEEGLRIAEDIGDDFLSRQLRYVLGWAQVLRGDLIGCAALLGELVEECIAANDLMWAVAVVDLPGIRAGLPRRCCERAEQRRTRSPRTRIRRRLRVPHRNGRRSSGHRVTWPPAMRPQRGKHMKPPASAPRWIP